jgi:AmmeMemoRadiSam system protein B
MKTAIGLTSPARVTGLFLAVFLLTACQEPSKQGAAGEGPVPPKTEELPPPKKIKDCAVAGLFFPKDAEALNKEMDTYLEKATPQFEGRLRGLVVPHAGYQYSGPVAAFGYKLLKDRDLRTVILLAPTHYADFDGAALTEEDAFRTPLGMVRVSPRAAGLARTPPFAINPRAVVQTPGWAESSPVRISGPATPHTWEHSEEVQVPFLQRVLKDFTLIPVVLGRVDEAEVAKGLLGLLDNQTLVIASSDLSHYLPYETARQTDAATVKAICDLNAAAVTPQRACGHAPIATLIHLAKAKGWKTKLLDYRNSGDTSGDKTRGVVGYAAVAF